MITENPEKPKANLHYMRSKGPSPTEYGQKYERILLMATRLAHVPVHLLYAGLTGALAGDSSVSYTAVENACAVIESMFPEPESDMERDRR